jgi:hypothetical protein
MENLPHPNTSRWIPRRKAAVVAAVRNGRITMEAARNLYRLSEEELRSWDRAFQLHGVPGLRATRIQIYRSLQARQNAAQSAD